MRNPVGHASEQSDEIASVEDSDWFVRADEFDVSGQNEKAAQVGQPSLTSIRMTTPVDPCTLRCKVRVAWC